MKGMVGFGKRLAALAGEAMCLGATLYAETRPVAAGDPAPALSFTSLLQAPGGAKADWSALRGKVVVLEFWATWCAGCVIEIPHLNDLEKKLAESPEGAKIQFIAVDDEEPEIVQSFTAKHPIAGWLGIDTTKATIKAYGADVRPKTVVINGEGKIAGILNPEQLTAEPLEALAEGKTAELPKDQTEGIREEALKEAKSIEMKVGNTAGGDLPIFDISVRAGDASGRTMMVHKPGKDGNSYTMEVLNGTVSKLLWMGAGIDKTRLTVKNEPTTVYSLHVNAPGGEIEDLYPAIAQAVVTATGMKMHRVTTEEDAWILTATPQAARLLVAGAGEGPSFCFWNQGKMNLMNGTLDCMASQLEPLAGAAVVNESGLTGKFSATFDLPKGSMDEIDAVLAEKLGLKLVKGRRKIERIVVAPMASSAPASAAAPAAPAAGR